ncbi:hypothetical protein PFISCL1PPCAC_899, partial [Pristionchus fissidentatus]
EGGGVYLLQLLDTLKQSMISSVSALPRLDGIVGTMDNSELDSGSKQTPPPPALKRSYDCSVCGKRFSQFGLLRSHTRTHSPSRPFKCHLCPSSFKSSGCLSTHVNIQHSEKVFECDTCMKKFALPWLLKKHQKVHEKKQ